MKNVWSYKVDKKVVTIQNFGNDLIEHRHACTHVHTQTLSLIHTNTLSFWVQGLTQKTNITINYKFYLKKKIKKFLVITGLHLAT